MENIDLSTSTVGKPMTGMEVKLVDWDEGSYRVTDKPHPRGEICLSGAPVAKGYFKQVKMCCVSTMEVNSEQVCFCIPCT
jgi:long-chain acyl-CoA synthetase